MAQKRTSTEAELLAVRTRRNSKRSKTMPPSDSSDQSIGSVSEASAMRSSPGVSEDTRQSSPPTQDEVDDDDSESTVSSSYSDSSSSDEDEDDNEDNDEDAEDEEDIPTLFGPKKPQIDSQRLKEDAESLKRKLQAFMPKMRQANSELAAKGAAFSMEDVAEDEQHIEMSLGLGVLEEQINGNGGAESDCAEEGGQQESDVMQTLLGLAGEQKRYTVEEVVEGDT